MRLVALTSLVVLASCSQQGQPAHTTADADVRIDATHDAAPDQADVATDSVDAESAGCNPIAAEFDCLLPYPSDVFRGPQGVVIPATAMPRDKNGDPITAYDGIAADGFGILPSIVFTLGVPLDPASLVPQSGSDVSVTTSSPTLLLNTATGALVPHFSEVYEGGREPSPAAAIRPLIRLDEGTRYIVAIRGARSLDGVDVDAPQGFAALRDAAANADAGLRDRYEDEVLSPLRSLGVDTGELDLAWDFTTRSGTNVMGDMLSVRDNTLQWLNENTPTVTIVSTTESPDLGVELEADTFRHVEGTFTAPRFMQEDIPGAPLAGTAGDRPVVGTIEVPFSLTIPRSVAEDPAMRPSRFVQYGHGFFGRRQEVISFVQSHFGNEFGFVMGAVDWAGMSRQDRDWLTGQLATSPNNIFGFVPRIHQGMANQLVFTEVIRNLLGSEPVMQLDGAAVFDPEQVYFIGISQGHILGGTFMALTPASSARPSTWAVLRSDSS